MRRWLSISLALVAGIAQAPPQIPRTWDEQAMAEFELPVADPAVKRAHISADYCYALPERVIYKTFPVYAPGREPDGYLDRLRQVDPEVAFDASTLRTEADWIRAGELVFDAPIQHGQLFTVDQFRDAALLSKLRVPVAADGTIPFARYVVRKRGNVEIGNLACAMWGSSGTTARRARSPATRSVSASASTTSARSSRS